MPNDNYTLGPGTAATDFWSSPDVHDVRPEPEVSRTINMIQPWETSLYTALNAIAGKVEKVGQCEMVDQEAWPLQDFVTLTAASAIGDTTIDVDNGAFTRRFQLAVNARTGEQVRVASVSTNTLTVLRAFGDVAEQAMVAGDVLVFTGIALEEGADHGDLVSRGTGSRTSYCQLFEQMFGITDIQALRSYRGVGEMDRLAAQQAVEFKKQQERAFVLGRPHKYTAGTGLLTYATAGVRYYASLVSNIDLGGFASYPAIARALQIGTRFGGSRTRFGLTSNSFMGQLLGVKDFSDRIRTTRQEKTWGYEITSIDYPGGVCNLYPSEALDKPGFENEILVLDMNVLRLGEFEPVKSGTPGKDTGAHREKRQLWRRVGLRCSSPAVLCRLHNLGTPR
jgi:hypothetical protein